MSTSTRGTGGLVLARIEAALNRLEGFAPLPYGAASGMLSVPGGAGRVDLGNLFLMLDWALPGGGPADLPLTLRYMSGNQVTTEFGRCWSMPYQRFLEWSATEVRVLTPVRAYVYEPAGAGPAYTPLAPGTNALAGSPADGWAETQQDGTAFHYDGAGLLRTIRNRVGTRWTLTWEAADSRVRSIAGPFGRRTSFAFDGAGMIRRVEDPGGRICTFAVDGDHNLVRAVTPALCVTSFAYIPDQGGSPKNRMVARIDPLGVRTTFTYDLGGTLDLPTFRSFRLPLGQITTLTSGSSPPRTTIVDPRGGRWTVTLDSRVRPVAAVDPLGVRTSYQWDSFSSFGVTRVADGRGVRTTFGYVETGTGAYFPSSVRTAAGVYQLAYDGAGRLRRATDELGRVSTLTWDAHGNRTAVVDPYGVRTSYAYDALGRLTAVVDGLGRRSTRTYDGQGRLAADVDPLGNRTSYAYDANNQVRRTVDPLGKIWTTLHDDVNRLTVAVDPLGARTSYAYDLNGRPTSVRNPLGQVTTRLYDANSRLVAVVDPLANRTTYGYDVMGNVVRTISPLGNIATIVYDLTNQGQRTLTC